MSEVRHHRAEITASEAGMRLDQALARLFTDYSRSAIKTWIDAGLVTVNSRPCRPRDPVRRGDEVHLSAVLVASQDLAPDPVDFEILFLDDACLVVNKPVGCVVHPGAGNARNTLANGLLHRFPELEVLPRAGLIHRLDKNTSGLLVVARHSAAYQRLQRDMADRRIKRVYDALANGCFIAGGTITAPIGRDPANRTRMKVRDGGREATTHFRVMQKYRAHTHLEIHLETGRTHQIRVHLAHLGHPIVGDKAYGARTLLPGTPHPDLAQSMRDFPRQALHARRLEFQHPTINRTIEIEAPMPEDMATLVAACRLDLTSTPKST